MPSARRAPASAWPGPRTSAPGQLARVLIWSIGLQTLLPLPGVAAKLPPGYEEAVRRAAPQVIAVRRDLHENPELPNREFRTGKILAERLRTLGLEVRHPVAKTGIVAVLRGQQPGPVIALRAAIDALPLQEEGESPYKSRRPGIMHACGHDAQAALLLGTAEVLTRLRETLPGAVLFLFQPAEEGPPEGEEGGAALMLKEGALADPAPQAIIGFHVDPTLDSGTVGSTDGALFASSDRFVIEVQGEATHGAYPHTGVDPLPPAAEIILAVRRLVPEQADGPTSAVATVGTVRGGDRFNLIADRVLLEGTLRAQKAEMRAALRRDLEASVREVGARHKASPTLRFIGDGTAPTINDAPLARRLRPTLVDVYGEQRIVKASPQMGSEDFSALTAQTPGFYFLIGSRNRDKGLTRMTHTPRFAVDEEPLPRALEALVRLTWTVLTEGPKAPRD